VFFYPPAVTATLHAINSPANHFFAPNASHSAPIPGGNSAGNRSSWMQMELPYFNYYLKGIGEPLPQVSIDELSKQPDQQGNYTIKFFVNSKTAITDATMYYSAADDLWVKRKWIAVKAAAIKDGWYQAQIPANMIAKGTYCFASVSDARPVTVSSDLKEYN